MELKFGKEYKVVDELYYCDTYDVPVVTELRMRKDGFNGPEGSADGMLLLTEGTKLVYVGQDADDLSFWFMIGQHIYEFPKDVFEQNSIMEV